MDINKITHEIELLENKFQKLKSDYDSNQIPVNTKLRQKIYKLKLKISKLNYKKFLIENEPDFVLDLYS